MLDYKDLTEEEVQELIDWRVEFIQRQEDLEVYLHSKDLIKPMYDMAADMTTWKDRKKIARESNKKKNKKEIKELPDTLDEPEEDSPQQLETGTEVATLRDGNRTAIEDIDDEDEDIEEEDEELDDEEPELSIAEIRNRMKGMS